MEREWHEKIWKAIRENFEVFLEGYVFFIGGNPNDAMQAVRQRLSDSRFPSSKRWIYLTAACAHLERDEVLRLLAEKRDPPDDELARTVVDELGRRLSAG